jgi:aldose 1-epimerase
MMTKPIPGTTAESDQYRMFTLRNASDMTVTISERGAALRSWRAPDRYGCMADVLLAEPEGPAAPDAAPAIWKGHCTDNNVSLLHMAPGGTPGNPANLQVNYRLEDDGSLVIDYNAMAGMTTALRAKSNPYFNLNAGNADAGDHMLQIDADYYVEIDALGTAVGVAAVGGTAFDFRYPAPIGPRLRWPDSQIRMNGGFGHCFFVRSHYAGGQGALREVARVYDPASGRRLQMCTTEAALQFCTGSRSVDTPDGAPDELRARRDGFCLEANARPSLVSAAWPHIILHPGQMYRQTTVYRLSLQG